MTVAENKQNIVSRSKNFYTLGYRCSCNFLLWLLRLERLNEMVFRLGMIGIIKSSSSSWQLIVPSSKTLELPSSEIIETPSWETLVLAFPNILLEALPLVSWTIELVKVTLWLTTKAGSETSIPSSFETLSWDGTLVPLNQVEARSKSSLVTDIVQCLTNTL